MSVQMATTLLYGTCSYPLVFLVTCIVVYTFICSIGPRHHMLRCADTSDRNRHLSKNDRLPPRHFIAHNPGFGVADFGKNQDNIIRTSIRKPKDATTSFYTGVSHFRHRNDPNICTIVFSAGRHSGGTNTYVTIDFSKTEKGGNPFDGVQEQVIDPDADLSTFTWVSTYTDASNGKTKHYALFSGGTSVGYSFPSRLYSWTEKPDGSLEPEHLEWVEPLTTKGSARYGLLVDLGDIAKANGERALGDTFHSDGDRVSSSGSFDIVITGTGGLSIYSRQTEESSPKSDYNSESFISKNHSPSLSNGVNINQAGESAKRCGVRCSKEFECIGNFDGCSHCNGFVCSNPMIKTLPSLNESVGSILLDPDPDDPEHVVAVMPKTLPLDNVWRKVRFVPIPEDDPTLTTSAFMGVAHYQNPTNPDEQSYLIVSSRSPWGLPGEELNAPCFVYDYQNDVIVENFAAEGQTVSVALIENDTKVIVASGGQTDRSGAPNLIYDIVRNKEKKDDISLKVSNDQLVKGTPTVFTPYEVVDDVVIDSSLYYAMPAPDYTKTRQILPFTLKRGLKQISYIIEVNSSQTCRVFRRNGSETAKLKQFKVFNLPGSEGGDSSFARGADIIVENETVHVVFAMYNGVNTVYSFRSHFFK